MSQSNPHRLRRRMETQAFQSAETLLALKVLLLLPKVSRKKKKKKKTVVSFSFEEEKQKICHINFVKPAQKKKKNYEMPKDADIETEFLPDAENEKRKKKNRGKKYDKSGAKAGSYEK